MDKMKSKNHKMSQQELLKVIMISLMIMKNRKEWKITRISK